MIRLETVEDFEKVRKALKDSSSLPRYYCIFPFCYCPRCNDVKEFEAPMPNSSDEYIVVKCLGCDYNFSVNDPRFRDNMFWTNCAIGKIPFLFSELMKSLNSRKMQAMFFKAELERRITREKGELRKVQNRIKKFARLRS